MLVDIPCLFCWPNGIANLLNVLVHIICSYVLKLCFNFPGLPYVGVIFIVRELKIRIVVSQVKINVSFGGNQTTFKIVLALPANVETIYE